jgi:hypothetical protein
MSFIYLLGLGSSLWNTMSKTKLAPGPNRSLNEGNDFRSRSYTLVDRKGSYISYLHDVGKKHGEAHATRFVREKTGVGLREEEKGYNDLPSHFTKRKLYEL